MRNRYKSAIWPTPLHFGGRVMEAATPSMAAANGRECAAFGTGEGDHLFHDAQNQFGARGNGDFFEKPVQMRVDSVIRDLESSGNPRLRQIVKDTLDNLQFPLCEAQSAGNLQPGQIAEK